MTAHITLPRRLLVGGGALDSIGDLMTELHLHRPIVVTDPYLRDAGALDRIMLLLRNSGLEATAFAETVPDPTTESLTPALDLIAAHRADSIIGLGGGSPMDTAKALATLAIQGGEVRDHKAPAVNHGPALPVVAIPTTAGSGSEATQFTVITDTTTDEKMLCIGPAFLPIAAIVDHELTTTMPPRLTADTGIDALTHAVEAYVSRRANRFADSFALDAITAISTALPAVYADGSDKAARGDMMLAATRAGIAFSNSSVTLIHGMSRPIGAHFHVAHGLSNAMLFPEVTAYSLAGATDRYADCGRAYGAARDHDSDEVAARKFLESVTTLCRDLAVPSPESYGINRTDWEHKVPLMARQALASGSPANNPVIATPEDIEMLYGKIFA